MYGFLIFMIHHPKLMALTNDAVFGLVLDVCFHHDITQKLKILSLDDRN